MKIWQSISGHIVVLIAGGLATATGCVSTPSGSTPDRTGSVTEDIVGCRGTKPTPGVCQVVICDAEHFWDIRPAASGLACTMSSGTGGICDGGQYSGEGACVSEWPNLPQGLTGGIAYWDGSSRVFDVAVDGVTTLTTTGTLVMQNSAGWIARSDGDQGKGAGQGFYHQELGFGSPSVIQNTTQADPQSFVLPAGTACGFHNAQNDPPPSSNPTQLSTCMGFDPRTAIRPDGTVDPTVGCPAGWTPKKHIDANGNANGYFVWCEYNDPGILCEDSACIANTLGRGVAFGISSNADAGGFTDYDFACPPGYHRGPFMDDGRGAGLGLSACLPGS